MEYQVLEIGRLTPQYLVRMSQADLNRVRNATHYALLISHSNEFSEYEGEVDFPEEIETETGIRKVLLAYMSGGKILIYV